MFSKILSFLMGIWMFICSLLGISAGKGDNNDMIEYSADNKSVIITIEENPTTGYGWVYKISDESVISLSKNTFIPPETGFGHEALAGAPGTRVFELTGLKAGTGAITLDYERAWENEPVRTIVIKITVASDMTVTAELVSDTSM